LRRPNFQLFAERVQTRRKYCKGPKKHPFPKNLWISVLCLHTDSHRQMFVFGTNTVPLISRFFKNYGLLQRFCALGRAWQTAKTSDISKFWGRKQRQNVVQGRELRVARSSVGAEASPPPRAPTLELFPRICYLGNGELRQCDMIAATKSRTNRNLCSKFNTLSL